MQTTVLNIPAGMRMGRFQESGQVRRPASDNPAYAARGEREADQPSDLGLASQSPAATLNV